MGAELGDLRESRFVFMFEKQVPKPAGYFELAHSPFLRRHLLRLEHVAH